MEGTSGWGHHRFIIYNQLFSLCLDLWETDLPKELRRIYPPSFTDLKLKRLLFKFDELGVAEAKDLKYFNSKEVAELLKEALKPIEILKLMDYASGRLWAMQFQCG